uniref:Short-chain dehydrogenase/reductase n=1 Tax=Meyerozyma guilliermondii TaxID=4929 RepID=UPI0021F91F08|nr:Chain A, Short-chain dehydrogenase/reductase [Meyerozyma guilliermondii]7XWL_B Chain B, Short-chain dehydrogenase/reductase [Meyerozyma guilliermondii]7XWL_C Chain C, Short-chain dehydrogenase/reductase [Meyerozyma guilliermondii]7XWL_D Chain D, Short-chain dehydrogenase/reductase [Meyerozyma guilliermondii]
GAGAGAGAGAGMEQTYFISGANRGIGFSVVQRLAAKSGVKVIATARDPASATALNELAKENPQVKVVQLDISDEESIKKIAKNVSQYTDSIDVFVSNAAIAKSFGPLLNTPREQWIEHFFTNVLGPIRLFQELYPLIKKGTQKKVFFISSNAGSLNLDFGLDFSAFGQSKAALNYSTKELARQLKPENFIVAAVHPGFVTTDMGKGGERAFTAVDEVSAKKFFTPETKITPEESAAALCKLFESLNTTGKYLSYDGTELPW